MGQPATSEHTQASDYGFVFAGGVAAIDFVNTIVVSRGRAIDLLASPDAYVAWWRSARLVYPELAGDLAVTEANPRLLLVMIELRGALRTLFGALADGAPIPVAGLNVLNATLEMTGVAVEIGIAGEPRRVYVPHGAAVDGPMLAVAHSSVELLTDTDLSRLHRCANDRCVLLFFDTSKSATRRWCSTACMNRARSIQRYYTRKNNETPAAS